MNPNECIYVLLIIGLSLEIDRMSDLFFGIGQGDLRWVSPGCRVSAIGVDVGQKNCKKLCERRDSHTPTRPGAPIVDAGWGVGGCPSAMLMTDQSRKPDGTILHAVGRRMVPPFN